jgi:hypothetical protein
MTGSDQACSVKVSEAIGGTPDAPKRCRIVVTDPERSSCPLRSRRASCRKVRGTCWTTECGRKLAYFTLSHISDMMVILPSLARGDGGALQARSGR